MSVFRDDDEVYACIGGLLERVRHEPLIYDAVADSDLVLRFRCFDPRAIVTVDAHCGVNEILFGECPTLADVELEMAADIAHRLWLDELDVFSELLHGNIICKGSLGKLTQLLPLIRPARKHYPDHLREIGRAHLLSTGEAQ